MINRKDHVSFPEGVTFVTPFVIVYGTLRLGQSNYKNLLTDTQHVGTYRLEGWILSNISAGYTGKKENYIVVDVFNLRRNPNGAIKTDLQLYETNYMLDRLEGALTGGYYIPTMLKIQLEEGENPVFAKIYNANLSKDTPKNKLINDFVTRNYKEYPKLTILKTIDNEVS